MDERSASRDSIRPVQNERAPSEPAPGALQATGVSRNGLITVVLNFEGRVERLTIAPEALRTGPRRDSATIAAEIQEAFNDAVDNLEQTIRESTGGLLGGVESELDQLVDRYERTMVQLTDDIAEAGRKLGAFPSDTAKGPRNEQR
ncbi:YbaB/EbfC family DNA-binding protein [Actinomadura sp. KC216]|uniref:YbaB/EbfC family nucleoid-associated protein n=1 Tax=Actinomadura sp. KC216 TaxID=2530370 RepID=UPI0010540BED|nr:YbaB/EbfC family nucleoid-associated protein [Actinomadura sp. KC216]TDB84976.1 YbaB/EbfC family DNA-binding protein [Actinomadura sp. KC216]